MTDPTPAPNPIQPNPWLEPSPVLEQVQSAVKPASKRNPLDLILVLAGFVAVAGLAFAGGRLTAPVAAASTGLTGANGANGANGFRNRQFPGASGAPGAFGGGFGGLGGAGGAAGAALTLRGTVTEVTADHVTLRLASGTTVTIPISSTTTYHQETAGTSGDVTSGAEVLVQLSGRTGPNASGAPPVGAPGASAAPGASSGTGGFRLGSAIDITVLPK